MEQVQIITCLTLVPFCLLNQHEQRQQKTDIGTPLMYASHNRITAALFIQYYSSVMRKRVVSCSSLTSLMFSHLIL